MMQLIGLSETDSILFDLDGTLWDASASCATAWNQALKEIGYGNRLITIDNVKSFSGVKIEEILADFFNFVPAESHQALLDSYLAFLFEINQNLIAFHAQPAFQVFCPLLEKEPDSLWV